MAEEQKKFEANDKDAKSALNFMKNKDFSKMSRVEIFNAQKTIDEKNKKIIEEAYKNNKIDREAYLYIKKMYEDTMYKYGQIFFALSKALGKPKMIQFINLNDGKLADIYRSSGEMADKSMRCITPSTAVRLTFNDEKNNCDLYLDLPGMKDINRTIEKMSINGKYDVAYKKELKKTRIAHAFKVKSYFSDYQELISQEFGHDSEVKKILNELNVKYKPIFTDFLEKLSNVKPVDDNKIEHIKFRRKIELLVDNYYKNQNNFLSVSKEFNDIIQMAEKLNPNSKELASTQILTRYFIDFENSLGFLSEKKTHENYSSKIDAFYSKILLGKKAYERDILAIEKPYERMFDIYRCSVIGEFYDSIKDVREKISASLSDVSDGYVENGIKIKKTVDKFYGNETPHHPKFKGGKGYRDEKLIINVSDSFPFELQLKLKEFADADLKTHKIYEDERKVEELMEASYNPDEINQYANEMNSLKKQSKMINEEALAKHNRKVLEAASAYELKLFRDEWEEKDWAVVKDAVQLEKFIKERDEAYEQLLNSDYTSSQVEKMLEERLIVSPYRAIVKTDDIENVKDASPKQIKNDMGYVVLSDDYATIPNMKSFMKRYKKVIAPKYITKIEGVVPESHFEDYKKAEAERSLSKMIKNETINPSVSQSMFNEIEGELRDYMNDKTSKNHKFNNNVIDGVSAYRKIFLEKRGR